MLKLNGRRKKSVLIDNIPLTFTDEELHKVEGGVTKMNLTVNNIQI